MSETAIRNTLVEKGRNLTEQLDAAKADVAAAREQLAKATEQVADTKKAVTALQATHEKALADATAESDKLKAEIETLKKKIADLTKLTGGEQPEPPEAPEP